MFLLQLVELVLTYNFSNCDFEKIQKDYENIIFPNLYDYMNKVSEETFFKQVYPRQKGIHIYIYTNYSLTFQERKIIWKKIMSPKIFTSDIQIYWHAK